MYMNASFIVKQVIALHGSDIAFPLNYNARKCFPTVPQTSP